MDKKQRNQVILDAMETRGYPKNDVAKRRNLQNLLRRDRNGKTLDDVLEWVTDIALKAAEDADDEGPSKETLMKDLDDSEEMCHKLKELLYKADSQRDHFKDRAEHLERQHSTMAKSHRTMSKQNNWLKRWVTDHLPGNNIKLRCDFSYEFSDREWDNV